MTENIQLKLDQIARKLNVLKGVLSSHVEKNHQLSAEIEMLKVEKNDLEAKIQAREAELNELSERTKITIEQNAISPDDRSVQREKEIDDLVKEIEYCISQLEK